MRIKVKKHLLVITFFLTHPINGRSVHRPPESNIPTISIQSLHDERAYTVKDSHLEDYPHFAFDMRSFDSHLLPKTPIPYRNDPTKSISGLQVNTLIENLLTEVFNRKRVYSNFKILQTKNFNFENSCGLIVLKFKNHPFVLKLFLESPKTYLNAKIKGIEPIAFFTMGGGANRHLSGLTRIPNLKYIQKKLNTIDRWKDCVEFPRKWFWLPQDPRWMKITGYNLGGKGKLETRLPGAYAIIADEMNMKHSLDMPTSEKKKIVIDLCNDVDIYMDPHYTNFTFMPHDSKPFNIVIVDTEHFPTIVGFKKKKVFRNHSSWYQYLFGKYIKDAFFRTKDERIAAQTTPRELKLIQ